MPSVQPKAATMLARDPRERPAAMVKRTPVPGETTTMSEVIRNAMLTAALLTLARDLESAFPAVRPVSAGNLQASLRVDHKFIDYT